MGGWRGETELYTSGVDSVQGAPRRKRLGEVNGGLGRRCALSAVVRSAASVAHGVGRNVVGFSAGKVVHGEAGLFGYGAMQGWRVDVHSMPCTFVCGTRPERVRACGNTGGALGIHGACMTWSGRGLRRGLWLVWSAGNDWATSTVARGL
jgi:hypothetical protein